MIHRALAVDEILREIIAHVVNIHPPTAVSLACCAKSFEEPALSALWKTQTELPILIQTLPPDSWDLSPTASHRSKGVITFTRIPSGDEWTRVKRYASWMRVLGPSKAVVMSDDVFQQLSLATSGGPAFSQLKRLVWTPSYGWGHTRQFFSPRLVSVIFRRRRQPVDTGPTLASTIPLLPTSHLEELRLEFSSPPAAPIHSVLSEVVQRLNTCFKRISTRSPLTDAAWEHLASLPELKSLRVTNTPTAEISQPIPHQLTFPALHRVKIVAGDRYQRWGLLFPLLESSPLQQVSLSGHRIQGGDIPSQVTSAMLKAKLQRSVTIPPASHSSHALGHLVPSKH